MFQNFSICSLLSPSIPCQGFFPDSHFGTGCLIGKYSRETRPFGPPIIRSTLSHFRIQSLHPRENVHRPINLQTCMFFFFATWEETGAPGANPCTLQGERANSTPTHTAGQEWTWASGTVRQQLDQLCHCATVPPPLSQPPDQSEERSWSETSPVHSSHRCCQDPLSSSSSFLIFIFFNLRTQLPGWCSMFCPTRFYLVEAS